MDWEEGDYHGSIRATSPDGVTFDGELFYKGQPQMGECQLKRYDAEGELLLFGRWSGPWGKPQTGSVVIRLRPKADVD
jgi:hypothetical protein